MKKHQISLILAAAATFVSPLLHGEEMIDKLRELFKDKKPVTIGVCEDVRKLKYPGQKFWHVMDMTVSGKGQLVTPRFWGLFNTRKVIFLVHSSKLILREEVVSTLKELESGIIRTEFRVQKLDEQLGQSNGEFVIGSFSTRDIFKDYKTLCEKYGSERVDENPAWWLVPGLKILNKFMLWSDRNINSDGTVVVDKDVLKKNFPEMQQMVCKFRNFKGTVIYSTWEFGKGYTSIRFESSHLDADTKDALAKLIYRTNPISVKEILPDGKRSGDKWLIDSDTIGGIVFDLGLDFDDVDGALYCCHRGVEMKDGEDVPDEFALLKKDNLRLQSIEIPRDNRSLLSLVSRGGKAGDVAISFSPFGIFSIFDDHDAEGRHLYYLKEAHLEGLLKSKVKHKTSLLKNVEFKDANLKIKLNYSQVRIGK